MERNIIGWKKDKYDPRAKLHRVKIDFPDSVLLTEFLPLVRDQQSEGSCVGHAIGGIGTATAKSLGLPGQWFSPRWIYNGARFIEGMLNEDEGCYPKDALDWLTQKGWLLDTIWPYVAGIDTHLPPPSHYESEAAKYPMLSYTRIADGIDGICSAIAQGKYVALGAPWYDEWEETDEAGFLPEVSKFAWPVGGHETFFYGYDRPLKVFYGQNSWGIDWGKAGHYAMPFSAFDGFKVWGGYDAHYIDVAWGTEPKPPEPDPPGPDQPCWMSRSYLSIGNKAASLLGSKRKFYSNKENT